MIISLISDSHCKHKQITQDLPGGDLIIHAGDISSMGYTHEIKTFCDWYTKLYQYDTKIFIAGNHDFGFQDSPKEMTELLESYPKLTYLQDDLYLLGEDYDNYEDRIKVYGSPWQPRFCNWAFNVDRGPDIKLHWDDIPVNTDILITHGPPFGTLDKVIGRTDNLGCEELAKRIHEIKPKIHVFGHIHSGYGYKFDGNTHYINASILNERYIYTQKPITIDWDPITNQLKLL
ncbi:MAG: metallophosphatase domain-containing protein [Bacteroidetes bacterium]|nr:metallophosphatase domain-containing protein [Bacteroidota bacterium]